MAPNDDDIGIGEVVRTLRRIELLISGMITRAVYEADQRTRDAQLESLREDVRDLQDWKKKTFYGLGTCLASIAVVAVTVVLKAA